MKTVRTFIAISLPDDAQTELGRVVAVLSHQLPPKSVRWVRPELMHLTLRFLGDTAVSQLPAITTALDRLTAYAPFNLTLDDLGCFPNRKRPRVIWAGLGGDLAPARTLKQDIDNMLAPLGWEREKRPFRAHVTLGRVKDSRKLQGIEWGAVVAKMDVLVTAVYLIKSQLRPTGPVYTIHHTSHLCGSHQPVTSCQLPTTIP